MLTEPTKPNESGQTMCVVRWQVNMPDGLWLGAWDKEAFEAYTAPLLARIAELTEALKMALPFLESEAVIQGYGFYRPANPNNFWPDPESCSEEEIANHKAACEAFDAGNYRDDYGDGWITPSMHITRAPWGIGSYTDEIPELKARVDFCRAAMKEQP